jgi:hypothetical protein
MAFRLASQIPGTIPEIENMPMSTTLPDQVSEIGEEALARIRSAVTTPFRSRSVTPRRGQGLRRPLGRGMHRPYRDRRPRPGSWEQAGRRLQERARAEAFARQYGVEAVHDS